MVLMQNTNCSRPDVVLFVFQCNVIKSICCIKYILALVLGDQLSNGKDTDNSKFLVSDYGVAQEAASVVNYNLRCLKRSIMNYSWLNGNLPVWKVQVK